ncbi:MAG: Hpt domain-containing protein [Eubacteriales bacterium]|nr:Hpt domain-containing protein [Eubacteriales bacterium]
MTLKECYDVLGGDYENAVGRLMNDRILQKFVFKFLNDGSYDMLIRSMEAEDYKEAFRAAHTMKGVCQNLSFTVLGESSSHLTEALRAEKSEEYQELLEAVKEDYRRTVAAIQVLKAEC